MNQSLMSLVQCKDIFFNIKYPAIHITKKISSKHELIKWVSDNWDNIKPTLSNLPETLFKQADINTLAIGLWFKKLRKTHSWKEIDDIVTELEDKNHDFFGKDGASTPDARAQGSKLVAEAVNKLKIFHTF